MISISLSDYRKKVQAGIFDFPDFSEKCPICGGKNCAVRIGCYYRWAIDFDIEKYRIIFNIIPVARYLCKRVNKPKHKHKTFSLLPDTLIPYNRISIILMMYILQLLVEKECVEHTLAEIDSITPDEIFFSEKMIQHLLQVMEQARIKLILFFQHHYNADRGPPNFHVSTINEVIDYLLNDQIRSNNEPPCGAYHLSVQYYKTQIKYHKNARFLFGIASQFCR